MNTKAKILFRISYIATFIAAMITLVYLVMFRIDLSALHDVITDAGIWAPAIFILMTVVVIVFFLPSIVLTLTGGLLFGVAYGFLYNIIGITLGATAAFLISRYFAFDWLNKKLSTRLDPVMKGVAEEGWRFVAMVRLVPFMPFNILNYALGLTEIRTGQYVVATGICRIPFCIAYTYLGHLGAEAAAGERNLVQHVLIAIGLIAIMVFLPRLIKRIRKRTL